MMVAIALILATVFMIVAAYVAGTMQERIVDEMSRQRMAGAVSQATFRLRRLRREAIRQMHDATKPFIDAEGEE